MGKAGQLIKDIANQEDVKMHVCTVDSVDGSTCDVTPISGEAPLKKVRLNADINSDLGVVITPEVDSHVLVCEVSKVDSYVALFAKIKQIDVKIGSSTVMIKDGEISFNGGDLGGLVKVQELTTKLNNLITELNNLKIDYMAHTHPTAAVGSPSPPTVPFTGSFDNFNKSDYENTKVKH